MREKDLSLGIIMALVSLLYIWQTYQLPDGQHFLNSSRSFPLLFGSILLIISFLLIIKGLRHPENHPNKLFVFPRGRRGLFYIIWTGVYIFVCIPAIGFVYATMLYMIIAIVYYKEVKWYSSVIVTFGTVLFIYYVFNQWMFIRFP